MSIEDNKRIAKEFLAAVCVGDFDTVRKLMPENGTWWLPKHMTVSGTYKRDEFIALATETFKDASGPLELKFSAVTAEDDRVALEMESFLDLVDGRKYRNEYHMLLTVRNGQVISGREHMNTRHFIKVFDAQAE